MVSLPTAVFLSQLPLRSSFFKNEGWKKTRGPLALGNKGRFGDQNWDEFLRENFLPSELNKAKVISQKYSENLELKIGAYTLPVRYLTIWDEDYPTDLVHIFDPPPVIFLWGNTEIGNYKKIGVVGTRRTVTIMQTVAQEFIKQELEQFQTLKSDSQGNEKLQKICFVSGLAHGTDYLAHLAALEAKQANIAVLGSGLYHAGPARSLSILNRAMKEGVPFLLLSEFQPYEEARAYHFPRRNRILAGLVQELSVLQAPKRSGTLITVRYALEGGREIRVFDHPLFDLWPGSNDGARLLIEQGADKLTLPGFEARIVRDPEYTYKPGPQQLQFFREQLLGQKKINSSYSIKMG